MTEPETPRGMVPNVTNAQTLIFMGRAGPIDLWFDPHDNDHKPFLVCFARSRGPGYFTWRWASDAAYIIELRSNPITGVDVHLTLHDQCRIYTLCAPHNATAAEAAQPSKE